MKITFLGTGAAEGIPAINCQCEHCRRARKEGPPLTRERNAILFELPGYNLLVDTPPDVRDMINRYEVSRLEGIWITHAAYEHVGGIKEFEYWQDRLDLLAEERLFKIVKREHWTARLERVMFHIPYYPGAALYFGEFSILPFAVRRNVPIFGFSLKEGDRRVVYTSDTPARLTNYARCLMRYADLLIVNTPVFQPPKEDHITVVEAIALKEEVQAGELILTYINHRNKPHDELQAYVQNFDGVRVAYDGMTVEI
ncbi:MAG TPA: hypothetical protein G4O02_02100 [Caldilineae bacterium]|jgi:phosphoribosyl 1,2-cyclic phosphate phosphodiesterase|nr:hypothetical protein [Caldilineae bacterium]